LIEPAELDNLRDDQGTTIAQAMHAAGFSPERYREAVRHDLAAFIELHIEQGRSLFEEQIDVGIVQAIVGLYQQRISVTGRADHAGTTPMDLRRDALQGAVQMAGDITRLVEQAGRPAVATLGKWEVKPGAVNVVPEMVHFSLDLRHPDEKTKQRLAEAICARCQTIAQERGLTILREVLGDSLPSPMDSALQSALIQAAEACGACWRAMPSGAGHDSQEMARYLPTAMLFVPSVEGRSHSCVEYTTPEDAACGAAVLAATLYGLAYDGGSRGQVL
jgi:allantoate deiminase